MNWVTKKEEMHTKKVMEENIKLPDVVTFTEISKPLKVNKGKIRLGEIKLHHDKIYRFTPEPDSFLGSVVYFLEYEADDLCAIFLKLKELNGATNDNIS